MINWLLALLIVLSVVTVYVFWIRPILKTQPKFMEFYAQEQSFWGALVLKSAGLKQRITTALIFIAGFVVEAYDNLAPLFSQAGVDVTKIAPKIPQEMWPLITMGTLGLVMYFRKLSEDRQAAAAVITSAITLAPKVGG